MAYCTLPDVVQRFPQQSVIELTDDDLTGEVVYSVFDSAASDAAELMDSYLRGRYALPLATPFPPLIIQVAVDLTIYRLYSRRFDQAMPEEISKRYDRALKTLREIQSGTARLFDSSEAPPPVLVIGNKAEGDRMFSLDTLNRMI